MDQNMTLEKRIAAELYSYQGKMSVFVDDLRGSTVEIGADEEFETASTIKAFILAVLYLQASRGRADLEEEITYEASQFVDGSGMLRALGVGAKLKVKDTATMMIICSDNIATNMIIDYLGLDTINACIRELGFGHTVLHNPLHFDRYDKLGTTTPRDYAALFAQVAKGTLVSKEASAAMPVSPDVATSMTAVFPSAVFLSERVKRCGRICSAMSLNAQVGPCHSSKICLFSPCLSRDTTGAGVLSSNLPPP